MNKTFAMWLAEVDKAIQKLCGLSYKDLADQPFIDWYEDGVAPKAAAKMALASEQY